MIEVMLVDDDNTYTGKTVNDILVQLKMEDWTSYNNLDEYKTNIASRVKKFNGVDISYDTDKEFLDELVRVGVIDNYRLFT